MARSTSSKAAVEILASGSAASRTSSALILDLMAPGSLALTVSATIVTGSLVATFRPQVSLDNTNWFDVKPSNNAAFVTITATGTACLQLADLTGFKFFRVVATLTGASVAAGDLTQVSAVYRKFGSA